jgi:nitrogen regulatory protein A
MESPLVEMTKQLNQLRSLTDSDFSAFATISKNDQLISWKYASGNRNERYKHMQGKPGKGLAGLAVRADRVMILDVSNPDYARKRLEYPIMLAENLQSAVAVPVKDNEITCGVLLTGSRTLRKYSQDEVKMIQEISLKIASIYKLNFSIH